MRTTKAVVEENMLEVRNAGPPLAARMDHHAVQVIYPCMVGAHKFTPLRRLKVRKFGTPLAGFGDRVWPRQFVMEIVFNPRCTVVRSLGFRLMSSRYIVVVLMGGFPCAERSREPTPEKLLVEHGWEKF